MLPSDLIFHERGWLSSNSVILRSTDSACVIDTGYATHSDQTCALIDAALGDQFRLAHVLNTHLHSDHCGGNAQLAQRHPDALIWVPEPYAPAVQAWDADALSHQPTGQQCEAFQMDRVLVPGAEFQFGQRKWQILHAPGHDDLAVMLFCPEDSILISGDALWGNGFGVVFPAIYSPSGFDRVEQTLDLIDRLKPAMVIPGHGPVFTDVADAMSRARSRLSYFVKQPLAHSLYAAKVLIKFKLLEWGQIEEGAFFSWVSTSEYLIELHRSFFAGISFTSWIRQILDALVQSGSCQIDGTLIQNQ